MLSIDKSLPIIVPKIYLCKPNKQVVGKLKEAFEVNHKVNLGEINELSFQLPYHIELNNALVANPHIALCNVKYLVKFVRGTFEEYYQINKITDNMDEDSDYKQIECFSLPIEMKNKKLKSYTKDVVNATTILTDVIETAYEVDDIADALWTLDYVFPAYDVMYRSFEVSEKTLQDFLLEDITETFDDSILIFNTLTRTISLYHKDQLDDNKGLTFNQGKYLKTLSQEENTDEFITRLKIFGKDDLSIQEVNPTGKDHIEDFTFFTEPYVEVLLGSAESGTNATNIKITGHELTTGDYVVNKTRYASRIITKVDDDNFTVASVTDQTETDSIYKVSTHSTYMSDELCSALIDYNVLLEASYQIEDIAETGTTPTNIRMPLHGMSNNDWILNKTINEHRKVTVVDVDNVTVASITGQAPSDIIYKYKTGTFRKLLYEKEALENELTVLENYLFTLNTNKTLILNNIGVQKENKTYKSYNFTYSGSTQTKTYTAYDEGHKWVVFYKLSNITGLTVKLNSSTKTVTAGSWSVLGKLNDPESIAIQITGSTTGVSCEFVILRITDSEYSSGTNDELLNKYCYGKVTDDITAQNVLITAKETEITNKGLEISSLQTSLSYEDNFSSAEIKELQQFEIEETWSDENHTEPIELFESGINKFIELNTPKNLIKMSIVNFLECIEEQINWDKLNLGDYIRVKYNKFNSDYTLQIIGFDFDYENNNIDITLSSINSKVSNEETLLRKIYETNEATKKLNMNKINWNATAINFESRNDRITAIPANPVIADDGTTIDHTLNTDGSCNISFEWSFSGTGDAYAIDGFYVYVKTLDTDEPYVFGSSITKEKYYVVRGDKRNYILLGTPCDQYYTFGIQAYRKVDADINSEGILLSDIVSPLVESPYLPSAEVAFIGDVQGTIDGTAVADVLGSIANAQETADGQVQCFYQVGLPTTGMYFGDIAIDLTTTPPTTANIYRYENTTGGSTGTLDWYAEPTNGIGIVFLNAYNAQQTANGKITVFYQGSDTEGIPTSLAINDLWVDKDDKNKKYRAAIVGADSIAVGEWESVRDLGVTRSAATYIVADGSTSNNVLNADYVIPVGSTSAQETINAAIAALPAEGGKVLLLEGTYIMDGAIVLPSNAALEGQGRNTILKIADNCPNFLIFTRTAVATNLPEADTRSMVPRYRDSRFGKGILVEDSTLNMITTNQADVETDTTGFVVMAGATLSRDTTEHCHGAASLKVITPNAATAEGVYITDSSPSISDVIWGSVYLKGSGNLTVRLKDYTNNVSATQNITLTSTWTRVSLTITTGAINPTDVRIEVFTNGQQASTFWADCFFMHNNEMELSWTDGSRRDEALEVVTEGTFNASAWTLEIEFTPVARVVNPTYIGYLWEYYVDDSNYFCMGYETGGHLFLGCVSGGAIYGIADADVLQIGTHYSIMATGDGSHIKLYKQGSQIGVDTAYVNPVGTPDADMIIGSDGDNPCNGIVAEVRFSNIARLLADHQAYYNGSIPLSRDANTTVVSSLNETLDDFPGVIINANWDTYEANENIAVNNLSINGNSANNTARTCGIFLRGSDRSVVVSSDTAFTVGSGIHLEECPNSQILNNTSSDVTDRYGLEIGGCINSSIIGNICQRSLRGIYVDDSEGGDIEADNITLIGNICTDNIDDGFYYARGVKNIINGNTCVGNGDHGMNLHIIDNSVVSSNLCKLNGTDGIYLTSSDNNNISSNTCIENSQDADNISAGIYVNNSDNNNIQNNVVRYGAVVNHHKYGIRVASGSDNVVTNNDLLTSGDTSSLSDAGTNTVTDLSAETVPGNRL